MTGIEKALETERTLSHNSVFASCVAKIKTRTAARGVGNIGLKELLMEPIQRIPRYRMVLEGKSRIGQPNQD
jgi:hypothetical protein